MSLEPFTPWNELTRTVQLKHIPAIGPSLPLLSYIGAFKFVRHAQGVLQEGYDKVRSMTLQRRTSLSSFHLQYKIFRVAMINRWLVIVSGAQMNEELRKFPDEEMSFVDAVEDVRLLRLFNHCTLIACVDARWFTSTGRFNPMSCISRSTSP